MSQIKEYMISSIGEPIHLKLEKNTNGYQWEIGIYGDDLETVIAETVKIDERMRKLYGPELDMKT